MKKLTTLLVLFFLAVGLFAAGPEIPIIDDSERDVDISECYNYINNSCTNSYSIYAIKDTKNKFYGICFSNTSCITDVEIMLGFTFKNEKLLNNYLRDIDTLDLEKSFEDYRTIFINAGVEPTNIYSLDRKKIETQLYEYYIF